MNTERQRWEHLTVSILRDGDGACRPLFHGGDVRGIEEAVVTKEALRYPWGPAEILSGLGALGWELVAVVRVDKSVTGTDARLSAQFFLKRPAAAKG